MSDASFDHVYDPLAMPNPAYEEDPAAVPSRLSSWERRGLAQALLARARARQDAIADAFVDAILDGKISLFRLLLDLEQAAVNGEAEAQEARLPTLADILIPMLERERSQADAAAAEQASAPAPSQQLPVLPTPDPAVEQPAACATLPHPGVTDMQAAAQPVPCTATADHPGATPPAPSSPCRSRPHARKPRPRSWLQPDLSPSPSFRQSSRCNSPRSADPRQRAPQHWYRDRIPLVSLHKPPHRLRRATRRTTRSHHGGSTPKPG